MTTVLMAARRAAKTIERAVASCLAQGRDVCVHVGVDGACPQTRDALAAIGSCGGRVLAWTASAHVGPYVVRNSLVATLAPSDDVCLFDADDEMLPGRVAKMKARLGDLVYTAYLNLLPDGRRAQAGMGDGVPLVRRSAWNRLGGFRGWRCAADTEMKVRAQMAGMRVVVLREPLMLRGITGNSEQLTRSSEYGMGSAYRKARADDIAAMIARARCRLGVRVEPTVTSLERFL